MSSRTERLQTKMRAEELDAFVILSDENRFYFSGLKSSAGMVLVTQTEAFLLVDFRYVEAARKKSEGMRVVEIGRSSFDTLCETIRACGVKRLAYEEERISLKDYRILESRLPSVELIGGERMVTTMRQEKDEGEIALIAKAQSISEQAFLQTLEVIRPGMTEKELRTELEYRMQRNGGEGLAFETIVVSGANSSMPHGVPTDKKIETGDFITMDFGCTFGGYCSDMTRTVAVGSATEEMQRVYDTVLAAQLATLEQMHSGMTGAEIDAIGREVIEKAGYGRYFGHALGHSVGIEIHETPNSSPSYKQKIGEQVTMSVEPGIYLPGQFGVRIEDLVILTKTGPKNLNRSNKTLLIV